MSQFHKIIAHTQVYINLKMTCSHRFFVTLSIYFAIFYQGISAKLQFCWKGQHEIFSEFGEVPPSTFLEYSAECPGGILFNRPVTLQAVSSDMEGFCIKESVCSKDWHCGMQKQSILAQVITFATPDQNDTQIFMIDQETSHFIQEDGISDYIPECHPNRIWSSRNKETVEAPMIPTRSKREIAGLVPSERSSSIEDIRREVDDQTKRLFYYLTGINEDQVNSHLRVVKLFKMSKELVSSICDPMYLKPKFLREIEKSFLFLLKEQGFDKLIDLDLESYSQLKQLLEYCAGNVTMVKFMGGTGSCATGTKVESVYTWDGGKVKSIKYERNENTFKWGEYDLVLDAAWSIMNVVHGGCFEAFAQNVNLHHKFQVAMEQLFHAALHLRWENPTQLADASFYDSIFLAKVNDTMEVMDACSRYLYLLTPFKIQLNRPIHETFLRRKKRSISSEGNEEHASSQQVNGLSSNKTQIGTCLPSTADMESAMDSMKASLCRYNMIKE